MQLARIAERFTKRNLPMPDINRRQAMLIDGAVRLDNPNGTAPGQWIDLGPQAIALLPGPPREMGADARGARRRSPRRAGRTRAHAQPRAQGRRPQRVVGGGHAATALRGVAGASPPIEATILAARGRIELHLFTRSADRDGRRGGAVERHRPGSGRARPRRVHHPRRDAGGTRGTAVARGGLARRGGRVVHGRAAGGASDRCARAVRPGSTVASSPTATR